MNQWSFDTPIALMANAAAQTYAKIAYGQCWPESVLRTFTFFDEEMAWFCLYNGQWEVRL